MAEKQYYTEEEEHEHFKNQVLAYKRRDAEFRRITKAYSILKDLLAQYKELDKLKQQRKGCNAYPESASYFDRQIENKKRWIDKLLNLYIPLDRAYVSDIRRQNNKIRIEDLQHRARSIRGSIAAHNRFVLDDIRKNEKKESA